MLGYTRMRNGLCAICRWSKNSEVNRRGRDKKITPGGGGFGVNGRRPLSHQLGGSTYAGEPGVTDCHGRRGPSH